MRQRSAQGGLEAVLHDKAQQHRRSALSGLQTAHLIAVASSRAPDGHDYWTVRLLAQKVVALGFVPNISPTTIHELLKKTGVIAGLTSTGVSPRSEGRCETAMKDVLDLYEEPYDAQYPTVYLDGLAHRYRKAVDLVEQHHFHIILRLSQGKRVGEDALVTDYCPNWSENSGAPLQPAGATGTFRPAETEHRRSSAFFQRTKEAGTPNAIAASLLMVDCWGRCDG